MNKKIFDNVFNQRTIDKKYLNKYNGFDEDIIADIEGYTESIPDILNDEISIKDVTELEKYRGFKSGELRNIGIFYSDGDTTLIRFKKMVRTSFLLNSEVFRERYMLPIKLLNGDVFTWIGYDPDHNDFKYRLPYSSDICWYLKEGNMLGNLDSINKYKGRVIYVTEGFFDAYRVNSYLKSSSIALLGSVITKTKYKILNYIKSLGYFLYYLPDYDEAGLKSNLIHNRLWTKIIDYKNEYTQDVKDFDKYCDKMIKLGLEENENLTKFV